MKYRKKPIIVDSTQWFKNGDHPEDNCRMIKTITTDFLDDGGSEEEFLSEGKVVRYFRRPDISGTDICSCDEKFHDHGWIDTREGGHAVCPGDWIITDERVEKDTHGHYYPCKPSIFTQTHEEVK